MYCAKLSCCSNKSNIISLSTDRSITTISSSYSHYFYLSQAVFNILNLKDFFRTRRKINLHKQYQVSNYHLNLISSLYLEQCLEHNDLLVINQEFFTKKIGVLCIERFLKILFICSTSCTILDIDSSSHIIFKNLVLYHLICMIFVLRAWKSMWFFLFLSSGTLCELFTSIVVKQINVLKVVVNCILNQYYNNCV